MRGLARLLLDLPPSKEEVNLKSEIRRIYREAREFDLPSTFMTYAKMTRKAAKMERELLKLEEERRVKGQASWRIKAKRALGYRNALSFAFFFFVYERTLVAAPLLEYPSAWMFPAARILALPNYSAGALSVVGWSLLVQRFYARILG